MQVTVSAATGVPGTVTVRRSAAGWSLRAATSKPLPYTASASPPRTDPDSRPSPVHASTSVTTPAPPAFAIRRPPASSSTCAVPAASVQHGARQRAWRSVTWQGRESARCPRASVTRSTTSSEAPRLASPAPATVTSCPPTTASSVGESVLHPALTKLSCAVPFSSSPSAMTRSSAAVAASHSGASQDSSAQLRPLQLAATTLAGDRFSTSRSALEKIQWCAWSS
eukprot:2996217-Rhodomonas_salina.1